MLKNSQRQFPCIMPSLRLGHTVYDLTALRLGRAALQLHCISPSTYVVLLGTDQERPNGAQNMEGWKLKNELEPAKCLWLSSQVNLGQGRTLLHLPSKLVTNGSTRPHNGCIYKRESSSLQPRPLVCATPFGLNYTRADA